MILSFQRKTEVSVLSKLTKIFLLSTLLSGFSIDAANSQAVSNNGIVQGPAANGANVAGNPVLTGGSDGTKARTFKTDNTGQLYIANPGGGGGGVVTQSDHTQLLGTSYQGGTWLDQVMGVNGTSIATAINPFPVSIQGALPAGTNVIGHVIVDSAPTTAVTGTFWQATQPVSGTFFQATQPVSIAAAVTIGAGSAVIGHVIADSGSTTAVTGNVTVTQGTGSNLHTVIDSGTTTVTQATGSNLHVQVDTAPTTTVTGTVTANAGTGTFAVSAASLPLPSGASTAANQTSVQSSPGSSATTAVTIQGSASGVAVPISGTVTTTPSGTQTISGTVTANAGTGTMAVSAVSLPLPTGAAADSSVTGLQVSQGSTTSGQKGSLSQGAVTTSAPSYTTAQTSPISLDISGNLRTSVNNTVTVGTHAVTQSGTWQNQITDGTTVANVGPASGAQTGQTYLQIGSTYREAASLTAGSLNADLIPSTDLSGYRWISVQITGVFSGTLTFQASNDNSNFVNFPLTLSTSTVGGPLVSTTGSGMFYGSFNYRYLRVRMTAYSSGTANGTAEYYTLPGTVNSIGAQVGASQSGTWTVQPGNTANTTPWLTTNQASATGGYSFSHISTNATTTAKSGAGTLHTITINTPGATDTLTVYDNTAGSGTVIAVINDASTNATTLTYDLAFTTGLTIVSAGTTAPDVSVSYKFWLPARLYRTIRVGHRTHRSRAYAV